MVTILKISAKIATLGLLEIRYIDIIISLHDVTKKIFLVSSIIL